MGARGAGRRMGKLPTVADDAGGAVGAKFRLPRGEGGKSVSSSSIYFCVEEGVDFGNSEPSSSNSNRWSSSASASSASPASLPSSSLLFLVPRRGCDAAGMLAGALASSFPEMGLGELAAIRIGDAGVGGDPGAGEAEVFMVFEPIERNSSSSDASSPLLLLEGSSWLETMWRSIRPGIVWASSAEVGITKARVEAGVGVALSLIHI